MKISVLIILLVSGGSQLSVNINIYFDEPL